MSTASPTSGRRSTSTTGPVESLRIDKPTGPVTLRLTGRDTLVMIDPERGELAYRRHAPAP